MTLIFLTTFLGVLFHISNNHRGRATTCYLSFQKPKKKNHNVLFVISKTKEEEPQRAIHHFKNHKGRATTCNFSFQSTIISVHTHSTHTHTLGLFTKTHNLSVAGHTSGPGRPWGPSIIVPWNMPEEK